MRVLKRGCDIGRVAVCTYRSSLSCAGEQSVADATLSACAIARLLGEYGGAGVGGGGLGKDACVCGGGGGYERKVVLVAFKCEGNVNGKGTCVLIEPASLNPSPHTPPKRGKNIALTATIQGTYLGKPAVGLQGDAIAFQAGPAEVRWKTVRIGFQRGGYAEH